MLKKILQESNHKTDAERNPRRHINDGSDFPRCISARSGVFVLHVGACVYACVRVP